MEAEKFRQMISSITENGTLPMPNGRKMPPMGGAVGYDKKHGIKKPKKVKVKAEGGGDGGGGGGDGEDDETVERIDRGGGVTEDENGVLYGADGVKLSKEVRPRR